MANVKITDLGAYTNPVSTDVLPIVDVGADVTKKVSIADLLENAGSGTAAAPGIAFDGDNTGIYRPGAGQLAISTNGTGRLFVDASGRVGINNASPSSLLSLGGSVSDQKLLIYESSNQRYGFGLQASELRMFGDNSAALTFGHVSATDGTTFSEKARIDSSGRLLVNTSTSLGQNELVQIVKSDAGDHLGIFSFDATAVGQPAEINLSRSRSDTKGTGVALAAEDNMGSINFRGYDGDNYSLAASIIAVADGEFNTSGDTTDSPGRLVFSTTADGASSPTERMRIDSAGLISVNTADGSADGYLLNLERNTQVLKVDCNGTGDVVGAYFRHARGGLAGFTGKMISFVGNDGTEEGSIVIGVTSTAYNTSSDYRRKENQQLIADGIQRIKNLRPYRFNFIKHPELTVDGFFAHEVQEVVPEAITGQKDAVDADGNPVYQGIDQSKLVPLLTAALQEVIGRIETLEAEVAALKGA